MLPVLSCAFFVSSFRGIAVSVRLSYPRRYYFIEMLTDENVPTRCAKDTHEHICFTLDI